MVTPGWGKRIVGNMTPHGYAPYGNREERGEAGCWKG
jgi:hypothetical protein